MAKKSEANTRKTDWTRDWTVGVRVWIERSGNAVLGEGRAELLAAIGRDESITKAAKAIGMSYRRAWKHIQEVNEAAGEPLVEAATGGPRGGGARLTPHGRLAVEIYEQVRLTLVETAAGALRRTVARPADAVIHIAAAISLQEAIGQILAEYALRRPSPHVRAIFGASNELADHLLAGAPGDLIISAEPAELDRLLAAGLIVGQSRQAIAHNGLSAVGAPSAKDVNKVSDLLHTKVKRIALAEPACPLGNYTRQYLELAGIYTKVLSKALHVDNSRAVLAAVVAGAAQVGIAFSSDASRSGAWQTLFRVPVTRVAATYEAAIVGRRREREDVETLLEYLNSPAASRCLRRCGLRPIKS